MGSLQLLSRIVKGKVSNCWIKVGMEMEWNGIRRMETGGSSGRLFSLYHYTKCFCYLETVLYFWGHVATFAQDIYYLVSFIIGLRASALKKQ